MSRYPLPILMFLMLISLTMVLVFITRAIMLLISGSSNSRLNSYVLNSRDSNCDISNDTINDCSSNNGDSNRVSICLVTKHDRLRRRHL